MTWREFKRKWTRAFLTAGCVTALLLLYGCTAPKEEKVRDMEFAVAAAHEIPQEVGDFMVLLHSGFERSKALLWNVISGLTSMLGGIAGYFLLDRVEWMVPYAFAIAAASFIYIALSDLMPEIAHQEKPERFYVQLFFILIGVAMAVLATGGLHEH